MKTSLKLVVLVSVALGLLSACKDEEQGFKASKRPDVAPYMGANDGFMAKGWTPGNQVSWTQEINKRNQNQTEYSRIK